VIAAAAAWLTMQFIDRRTAPAASCRRAIAGFSA